MKINLCLLSLLSLLLAPFSFLSAAPPTHPLRVVATLPDYADLARAIGGDRIQVSAIVQGDQDAHFIRPKPSFVNMVRRADVLIATGLDLELWLPTVVNKSGNRRVRSGEIGYIAASRGMHLLDKPKVFSRMEGGVHIYGNPHVTSSPVNMRIAARNIATGLIKNDPAGKAQYEAGLKTVLADLSNRLFGKKLVSLLGGDLLSKLAEQGKLYAFLKKKQYQGAPLINQLGGWMQAMLPLRNSPIVTYHENWAYFVALFGLKVVGTIEVKPAIPPSPRHVAEIIAVMKENQVKTILAASYFDQQKVHRIAEKVGAHAVIVPFHTGGAPGTEHYTQLIDLWVSQLRQAAGIH